MEAQPGPHPGPVLTEVMAPEPAPRAPFELLALWKPGLHQGDPFTASSSVNGDNSPSPMLYTQGWGESALQGTTRLSNAIGTWGTSQLEGRNGERRWVLSPQPRLSYHPGFRLVGWFWFLLSLQH